jgi:hypothetical protein
VCQYCVTCSHPSFHIFDQLTFTLDPQTSSLTLHERDLVIITSKSLLVPHTLASRHSCNVACSLSMHCVQLLERIALVRMSKGRVGADVHLIYLPAFVYRIRISRTMTLRPMWSYDGISFVYSSFISTSIDKVTIRMYEYE